LLKQLIETLVLANPEKSNRQLAKMANTSHDVTGRARKRLESSGRAAHLTKRVDARGRKQSATKKPAQTGSKTQPYNEGRFAPV
jgi:hypothetical protein